MKQDFPIFERKIKGKPLIYLDSTATTQKPQKVIDAVVNYYKNYNSNIHRGVYKIAEEATIAYEEAHEKVASFINASQEEIIFTRNTTESLNLLAYILTQDLRENDEILLSEIEHHSNLVPWQQLAKAKKLKLKFLKLQKDGTLEIDKKLFTSRTKIVSVAHVSNSLGTINPVKEIIKLAHDVNAIAIVDAAQSVPHMKVDVQEIDCDFLAFSGHKMFAPMGIGVLYGKTKFLETMKPFLYGGDMIKEVSFENTKFNDLPWKFEAGTPNVEGAIGLSAAIDYINSIGIEKINEHQKELVNYALEKLKEVPEIKIYGPVNPENRCAIISFTIDNLHAHDISSVLDNYGIAVRGGHLCAMPTMKLLKVDSVTRISFHVYNTKDDVEKLADSLKKVIEVLK
jgi:cysteine desulfurase / selenocysteine lyase